MAAERKIGSLALIPKGEGRTFSVDGQQIAVFHTRAGDVLAIGAVCPHRGGPLADGLVGDATVICPLHERAFDLRTGAGVGNDDCVRTYPARVNEDGAIMLKVSP
jgi:nitrite reductase (NADH) small subunit